MRNDCRFFKLTRIRDMEILEPENIREQVRKKSAAMQKNM